jgi:hypothetical protein
MRLDSTDIPILNMTWSGSGYDLIEKMGLQIGEQQNVLGYSLILVPYWI